MGLGVSPIKAGNVFQMRRNGHNKLPHRSDHRIHIAWLIGSKPVAVIIVLQLRKKREEILGKAVKLAHL